MNVQKVCFDQDISQQRKRLDKKHLKVNRRTGRCEWINKLYGNNRNWQPGNAKKVFPSTLIRRLSANSQTKYGLYVPPLFSPNFYRWQIGFSFSFAFANLSWSFSIQELSSFIEGSSSNSKSIMDLKSSSSASTSPFFALLLLPICQFL